MCVRERERVCILLLLLLSSLLFKKAGGQRGREMRSEGGEGDMYTRVFG